MLKPATELQKVLWLLIAFGIAAYAIHGVMTDDLVMPYRLGTWRHKNFGDLHLRGIWAIGGSVCLLLGAAGFVVLFLGSLRLKPRTKRGADPYLYLATGLIFVGAFFFLGISWFAQWFA